MSTVTPLPTPPSRQDPINFSERADNFLGALPTFGTELNLVAGEVNTNALNAETSASTATTQAGIATTQAGIATTKASEATTALNEAVALTEKYQGSLSSDPTLDKSGNPLAAGDWYVNTTTGYIRAYNGSSWVNGISAVAGVTSFNGDVGDIVYEVPQLTKPVNLSPISGTIDVKPPQKLTAEKSKSIYGTVVEIKFQISTSADFTTGLVETNWLTSETDTVEYELTGSDITEEGITYYWRVICRTVLNDTTYTSDYSNTFNFITKIPFFDIGSDIDGLSSLVTIQAEYNSSTTYSVGQIVIVRSGPRSFKEYKSLQNSNTGNDPATSPTFWELVYDNNLFTSGYFGEVLGNKCVVDKGEWNSTRIYNIGDMVVVANVVPPTKQSDLTAYVALTGSNLNKPPASNPTDWEQRNALPTGASLAQTLGIGSTTPEVLINNDSGWLKFVHQGKIKYIAKKTFMNKVSWNDIAKAEAVYGNRTVRIGSRLYRVSLLSGAEADPSSWIASSTATNNKGAGSEWNELIYRVHTYVPADGDAAYHGGRQVGSNWWNFSSADIAVETGDGRSTWCKETLNFNTVYRVTRGAPLLSGFSYDLSSDTATYYGWRPCLTLISEEEILSPTSTLYNAEATGVGPSVASLQYDPITDTGYYGEVTSAQFYTGTQISTATGVTSGTLHNDTEGWLKFYWHGQVLFIAKKTYRYGISWDSINTASAVYGVNLGYYGKKTITHSSSSTSYDVKLMKGAAKDPSPASSHGRQWNELLYRVCTGTETGEIGNNWATLSASADLGINAGGGSYSWTQEVYQPDTASRVGRGGGSLSGFSTYTSSDTNTTLGWRPCLALAR